MFSVFKKKVNDNKNEESVIRKPSESLGSVLSESVPAASQDVIRSNEKFQLSDDNEGNLRYLVMTLDVTDIGGLNKRMKHDPDKGQFIECVNCGNIEAHVSEEGILNNTFVIIPTEKTLEALSEFSFLANKEKFAKFIPTCVTIYQNGSMDFEEYNARVDFNWFYNISNGITTLKDSMKEIPTENVDAYENITDKEDVVSEKENENEEVTENEDVVIENENSESSTDDINSLFEVVSEKMASEVEAITNEVEEEQEENIDNNYVSNDEEDFMNLSEPLVECPICHNIISINEPCPTCGYDINQADYEEISVEQEMDEQAEVEEISSIDVSMAVERLFHAGDLDLEISPQPFDVQFIKENTFTPISDERGDSWLDGYVTQKIKNANAELLQLHNANLFASRNRYLSIMTDECENIAKAVDLDDPSNAYAKIKKTILDNITKKRDEMEMEVDKRRTELQEIWRKELAMIEESAAAGARRNYLDKYAKSHEASLRDVETSLSDEIDIEYNKLITELNARRKQEAQRLHDIAVTQTLIVIGNSYEELLKEENNKRKQILSEIQEYIDTHRKDEVARNEVLAEAQRQKDEATRVTEEFARKIDTLTAEHNAACEKLKQEIDAAHVHEETVKNDLNTRIETEQDKYSELDAKYQNLMDRYVNIDAEKKKEFESYINTLENDKKAAEEHLAHVDIIHNKYNKVAIIVWVAISVATFAIGILVGSRFLGNENGPNDGHYSISLTTSDEEAQTDTTN